MSSDVLSIRGLDIVSYAISLIGSRPINGCTGIMKDALKEVYQGNIVMADSAASAIAVSKWNDESEKMRLEDLFRYASLELQNYNTEALVSQLSQQNGAMRCTPPETVSAVTVASDNRWDPNAIASKELIVDRPGFPGEKMDILKIGSRCAISIKCTNPMSRWRELTRAILSAILPLEAQRLYSAAKTVKNFLEFPSAVIRGIEECCALGSMLSGGIKQNSTLISIEVQKSLQNRLNEVRKLRAGSSIDELVKNALLVGWVPPGLTREEACAKAGVNCRSVRIAAITYGESSLAPKVYDTEENQDEEQEEEMIFRGDKKLPCIFNMFTDGDSPSRTIGPARGSRKRLNDSLLGKEESPVTRSRRESPTSYLRNLPPYDGPTPADLTMVNAPFNPNLINPSSN